MIRIELNSEEAALLREVLDSVLSDLRMEIADTDQMDFREMLKARKAFLQRLLEQLAPPSEPPPEP